MNGSSNDRYTQQCIHPHVCHNTLLLLLLFARKTSTITWHAGDVNMSVTDKVSPQGLPLTTRRPKTVSAVAPQGIAAWGRR